MPINSWSYHINLLIFKVQQYLMNSRMNRISEKEEILNKIPIFLAKTYQIVDNPAYSDIIEWNMEGDALVIKDIPRLTTEVFPQHFKHNNFLSFVRQLNMYGFHKVVSGSDVVGQVFKHQCFKRDTYLQLLLVKRKTGSEQMQNLQIVAIPCRQQKLQRQLLLLRRQHEELQNMMRILIQQNKTITAQNKAFAHMMGQMREKYRKKLQTLMLLFLFGKNNQTNDFILPPQLNHIFEAFQQMNRDGSPIYILPKKQSRKKNNNFPMITDRQRSQRQQKSEVHSQYEKDEKQDIFQVLNKIKSPQKRQSYRQEQQQKSQCLSESEQKHGVPVSPFSVTSRPERICQQNQWDNYLNRLQYSDCSELNLQKQ